MIRRFPGVVLAVLLIGGAGASPAAAEDPPPILPPPGAATPPVPPPSGKATPGPTYVITPGVGGSELPATSDSKAVEKAKKTDHEKSAKPAGSRARQDDQGASGGGAVGPQSPLTTAAAPSDKVGLLLRVFAALVALLVMIEISAVRHNVFRRPRRAVTAD